MKEQMTPPASLENVLLTVKEVGLVLKCSPATVYKLIDDGQLKCLKLGRKKVPYFEIERFLKDNLGGEVL